MGAAALADCANSGPTMISAPSASNERVPAAACAGVEPSSAVIRRMSGLCASNSASWAAFIMLAARARVDEEPFVNGRRMPTRTGVRLSDMLPSFRKFDWSPTSGWVGTVRLGVAGGWGRGAGKGGGGGVRTQDTASAKTAAMAQSRYTLLRVTLAAGDSGDSFILLAMWSRQDDDDAQAYSGEQQIAKRTGSGSVRDGHAARQLPGHYAPRPQCAPVV